MVRSFARGEFPLHRLCEHKRETVSVVLPAREVADTVGAIVESLLALDGLVDQVLVVDAASEDGTADVAQRAGAEVRQQGDLLPEFGSIEGKGDAMWRSLTAVEGDIVAFIDADNRAPDPQLVAGLLGPLLTSDAEFVKAAYRRPFVDAGIAIPDGGGRVNHLLARPLLSAFYPALGALRHPLAGEFAARRDLLVEIPFATGYAVEMAMLIDILALKGPRAIAQVDLGTHHNSHKPLLALVPMAYEILGTVCARLRREQRLTGEALGSLQTLGGDDVEPPSIERPALASLRPVEG